MLKIHSSKTSIKLHGVTSQKIVLFKLQFAINCTVNINLKYSNHKTISIPLTLSLVLGGDCSTYVTIFKIKCQNIFLPHNHSQWTET
jgi:hypothetical protein